MHQSYLKMFHRCLTGDDLQMSHQKMSCRRCFKDVLCNIYDTYNVYLIYDITLNLFEDIF